MNQRHQRYLLAGTLILAAGIASTAQATLFTDRSTFTSALAGLGLAAGSGIQVFADTNAVSATFPRCTFTISGQSVSVP